jgi:hypothetical protein
MDSSTWPRASSKRTRVAGLLIALVIIAPIVWLTMLEVGYVLAYQACADRTSAWIHKPNVAFTVIAIACAAGGWWLHGRWKNAPAPIGFLAGMALLVTGLIVIVVIASAIPPLILHPCD